MTRNRRVLDSSEAVIDENRERRAAGEATVSARGTKCDQVVTEEMSMMEAGGEPFLVANKK